MPELTEDAEQRRRLRSFVMAHHPDRGGDADEFITGLAALRQGRPAKPDQVPLVYRRRRGLAGWLGIGRPSSPPRSLD